MHSGYFTLRLYHGVGRALAIYRHTALGIGLEEHLKLGDGTATVGISQESRTRAAQHGTGNFN